MIEETICVLNGGISQLRYSGWRDRCVAVAFTMRRGVKRSVVLCGVMRSTSGNDDREILFYCSTHIRRVVCDHANVDEGKAISKDRSRWCFEVSNLPL